MRDVAGWAYYWSRYLVDVVVSVDRSMLGSASLPLGFVVGSQIGIAFEVIGQVAMEVRVLPLLAF